MNKMRFIEAAKQIRDLLDADHAERLHAELVCENLATFLPNPPYELRLAALAHDIDRVVQPRIRKLDDESYDEYKQRHAMRSTHLTANILEEAGCDAKEIITVCTLVEHHEVGGTVLIDALRDADSLAYFELNAADYIAKNGYEDARGKVLFMYDRASDKAKKMIRESELLPQYVIDILTAKGEYEH